MTVKYIDNAGIVVTDSSATKIEPVQNGLNYLVTSTTDYLIPVKNLVEVTNV